MSRFTWSTDVSHYKGMTDNPQSQDRENRWLSRSSSQRTLVPPEITSSRTSGRSSEQTRVSRIISSFTSRPTEQPEQPQDLRIASSPTSGLSGEQPPVPRITSSATSRPEEQPQVPRVMSSSTSGPTEQPQDPRVISSPTSGPNSEQSRVPGVISSPTSKPNEQPQDPRVISPPTSGPSSEQPLVPRITSSPTSGPDEQLQDLRATSSPTSGPTDGQTAMTQWYKSSDTCDGFGCIFKPDEQIPLIFVKRLGYGAFGVVDMVRSTVTRSEFARKEMRWGYGDNGRIEAIRKEMETHRKLQHRHITKVFGSYIQEDQGRGLFGILIEPLAEYDLNGFLDKIEWEVEHSEGERKINDDDFTTLNESFGCLASGLFYLHDGSIKHKDIKPANILVHKRSVLLTDFGLSTDFSERSQSASYGVDCTRKVSDPVVSC